MLLSGIVWSLIPKEVRVLSSNTTIKKKDLSIELEYQIKQRTARSPSEWWKILRDTRFELFFHNVIQNGSL